MAKEEKQKNEPVDETVVVDVTAVPEPVETMPQEGATSGLAGLRSFVEERFGQTFESDEELLSFVQSRLSEAAAGDSVVNDILAEYPELYAVIQDLEAGKPFEVALAANVDVDSLKPLEGEEVYQAYEEARNARKERKKKIDEFNAQYESNREESLKILEDYFAEKMMDEEAGEAFASYIDNLISGYLDGKLTRELLDIFYRGMHYDKDMESAREAGAIDAKNARIDAERERASAETDGMPTGGSAVGVSMPEEHEDNDIFAEIGRNSRRRQMYGRK